MRGAQNGEEDGQDEKQQERKVHIFNLVTKDERKD